MSKTDKLRIPNYLEHIIEAILRIHSYTDNMIENEFLQNKLVQDAVIRNIEIIGEAAHNIERNHPNYAKEHADIPWSDVYLMRNRVAHGYFSTDFEIVWRTIENDLPLLEQQIQKLLKKFESY